MKFKSSIIAFLLLAVAPFAMNVVEDSRSRFVADDEVLDASVYGCIDELGKAVPGSRFAPENSTLADSSDVPYRIYRVAVPAGAKPKVSVSVKKTIPLGASYCEGAILRFSPVRASAPFMKDGLWMVDVYVPLYERSGSSVRLRKNFRLEVDFAMTGSGTNPGKRALSRVVNGKGAARFGISQNALRKSLRKAAGDDYSDVQFLARFLVGDRNTDNIASHSADGLYAVDFKTIFNAMPFLQQDSLNGIPLERLRLYGASADTLSAVVPGAAGIAPTHLFEVPIEIRDHSKRGNGPANGIFDDGDTLIFVGYGSSVWKLADKGYYHSVSPYSFYQYFQLGRSSSGEGMRLSKTLPAYKGSAKDVTLMRYLRAEKDLLLRDTYYGKSVDWEGATGKEWFWHWHSRLDSTSNVSVSVPQVLNLPGRVDGGKNLLQVSFFPHRSVWASAAEREKDQVPNVSLSTQSLYERMKEIRYSFAVNGKSYSDADMSLVAYATMQVENVPLKDSGNEYLLTMLPNKRQFDRFDGYTVAYQWNPVVDSAEWYLPGKVSGLIRLPVPNGVSLLKFRDMQPVGILASEGGYAIDSVSASEDVRYLAYRNGVYRTSISVEGLPERAAGLLEDIARINSKTEYLIISAADFVEGAIALGKFRSEGKAVASYATTVVNVEDIYRRYTGGAASPVAIRNYIAYAYSVCPDLKYVLLLGSGHYDYRGIIGKLGKNYMPPFELEDNVTEDFFAVLDSGEMVRTGFYDLDLAVGRLPVSTPAELSAYLDKAKDYDMLERFDHSEWRNTYLLTADDAKNGTGVDRTGHTALQEHLSRSMDSLAKSLNYHLNLKKVYLLDYEEDAAGQKKPAAEDLLNVLNQGALITTYFGHGSKTDWASEGLLKPSYLSRVSNTGRYTILNSFSCIVGRFDEGVNRSLSEEFLIAQSKGSIASIGAARETFATNNEHFGRNFLFNLLSIDAATLGEAFMRAKNTDARPMTSFNNSIEYRQRYNNEHYVLIGEPVIQMLHNGFKVSLDQKIDTLKALDKVKISGTVSGMDNGVIEISMRESRKTKKLSLGDPEQPEDSIDVLYDGTLVYSEKVPVVGGRYETDFVTPRKISFGDTAVEFTAWAYSNSERAIGRYRVGGITISGFSAYADSIQDTVPPTITIQNCFTKGSENSYADGQTVRLQSPACLQVIIEDSTAIDFREYADEGVSFEVEGVENPYHPYPYLEQSSKRAVVRKSFVAEKYPEGTYTFRVHALDVLGNSSIKTINLEISEDMKAGLADVFNVPNPVGKKGTTFYFKNLALGRESTVNIFIYNQHGRLVKVIKDAVSGVTHWDGRDNFGRPLANGLYHYVVRSEVPASGNFKAKTWTKKQKLLISR